MMHCRTRGNATRTRNFDPSQYSTPPSIWSTTTRALSIRQPGSSDASRFGGASYYLNGMVPRENGVPHGAGNQRLQHGAASRWVLMTISPATARPFSAAASEPSTSACRATTSTAFRITTCPMNTHRLRAAFTSAHQPARGNRRHPQPIPRTAAIRQPSGLSGRLDLVDTTYKAPGAAMWSLGVQHELKPSIILVVQYVGNLGWHQNVDIPIDNFPLNTPTTCAAESASTGLPSAIYPAGANELHTYPGYAGLARKRTSPATPTTACRPACVSRTNGV